MSLRQILIALAAVSALFIALRLWMGNGSGARDAAASKEAATDALPAHDAGTEAAPLNILLVGDSHLRRNDVADMLRWLAVADGRRPPIIELIAPGTATLDDHVARGEVMTQLAAGSWDFLVLQEQSQRAAQSAAEGPHPTLAPARALAAAAAAADTQTVLLMSWARRDGDRERAARDSASADSYAAMQARMEATYNAIAEELDVRVAPVGLAWQKALRARRDVALWIADGSHPTRAGSYLAACVLYATLFEADPSGNRYHGDLAADEARFLQRIASGL